MQQIYRNKAYTPSRLEHGDKGQNLIVFIKGEGA